jgi:membrane AbrB-like protein
VAWVGVLGTLLTAGVMALTADRLRVPGGPLVWALVAVAALHLTLSSLDPLPPGFRTAAQIGIGTLLGMEFDRNPLRALRASIWPLAALMVMLMLVVAGGTVLLATVTPLDDRIALLVASPAGASDMSAAALAFGLDAGLVAGLQLVRQLLVFVIVPIAFRGAFKR